MFENLAKPSQELLKVNLQFFADEGEPDNDMPDDNPEENVNEVVEDKVEEPEGIPPEEEFDEIVYNQQQVKIPKSERQKYLQMGYNYPKVHGKLTETESKIKSLEELTGMPYDKIVESVQQNIINQQAQQYVNQGMSDEAALLLAQQQHEINSMKQREQAREQNEVIRQRSALNYQEKEALKNKPFFKELDADVEATLKVNPSLSYKAVFNYILGERHDDLMEKERKLTQQRTVANIADKKSRGLTDAADNTKDSDVELTKEGSDMARAFGVNPKNIANYVKKIIKK